MSSCVSPTGTAGRTGTESASRVADVLLLFTHGPAALGVTEIARQLRLSKAVVHRILQSLASRQVVEVDGEGRGYRLGPAAVALGARALRDLDLRRAARPVLRRLRDETRETTTLSEHLGLARVYLDQFESPQEIKMTVELGRQHALHAGATGKAMLAFLPADVRDRVLAGPLQHVTSRTVTETPRLRKQLTEIATTGVATSLGERQHGAGSVAAPVFGAYSEVLGAISVCGPVDRFDRAAVEAHAPKVLAAAEQISRVLGWVGTLPDTSPREEEATR
ncbi:MAG: IclR family transcriptional regulator [Streptosporangiaceae bacterium]